MKVGNKIPFIKQWVSILLLLFPSLIKAGAIENRIETTRYILRMSVDSCAFNVYLNDIEVVSNHSGRALSGGIGIGEVLQPKNNILRLEVWAPTAKDGQWRDNSKCEVYIQGYDQIRKLKVETVTQISFYPGLQPDLSKPEELFNNTRYIDNKLGRSLSSPDITYSTKSQRYTIIRTFDVRDGYIEWPWYQSTELIAPFSDEKMSKLNEAYQELWVSLSNKELTNVRKLFQERISESSMSNHYDEDFYFSTMDFQLYFEDEEFKDFIFIPLNFNQTKLQFSLNNKAVQLVPSPLLLCHKENTGTNLNQNACIEFNPKFRFDGDKFVITR